MKDLIFVSAQPDIPYFHWQTDVYTHNFIEMGIKPEQIHVLFAMVNNSEPSETSLKLLEKGINVHHYLGNNRDKKYIPSLRPLILKEWSKNFPELTKCYFYHDSDIIFRKLPNFDQLVNDDICYLSDTNSYLGFNYIEECCKRYEIIYPEIRKNKLIDEMCEIIGISYDTIKEKQNKTGGAQYILKNVGPDFWDKVFKDCVNLYYYLLNFQKKYPIKHEIQMWTSDMWALLWNLWIKNKKTKISNELSFSWATDDIYTFEKHNILHMAGVTEALSDTKFYKGEFINQNPLDMLKKHEDYFDYVEETSATIKYIDVMKSLVKKI